MRTISQHKWTLLNLSIIFLSIAIIFAQNSESETIPLLSYEPEEHKALFPLNNSDYWGIILISLGLMIAASGGIGGGGIVVPLLILVLGFQPKHAIALSNFTILGSSLTNMVLNVLKTHPVAGRPLVDWDLILVMEPLTMAGAVVGAIVGKILPDWILTLALVTLLAHTTYTTLDKARSQYIKETKTMLAQSTEAIRSIMQQTLEEAQEEVERESLLMRDDDFDDFDDDDGYDHNSGATWAASSSSATEQGRVTEGKIKKGRAIEMTAFGDSATGPSEAFLTGSSLDSLSESNSNPNTTKGILGRRDDNDISDSNLEMDLFEKEIHLTNAVDDEKKRTQELRSLLKQERQTPVDRVLVMSAMVVVVVGINLVKGGGAHFPSVLGIECGSFWYWGLTAVVIIVILLVSLWARGELITKWLLKSRLHYKYLEGDIEWNYRNTVLYPCICVFAGLFAGMFGIGGGVVKGPLMLHMGVHPLVASATVAVMIMFTSVSATAMFVAFGTLQWDYAWFLFALGLVSTVVGQFGVSYFVDKYKRYSFISISIGSVVAISTILMGLQSIFELVDPTPIQGTESSSLC